MGVGYNPRIVTDGLIMAVDGKNVKSYDSRENLLDYSDDLSDDELKEVIGGVMATGHITLFPNSKERARLRALQQENDQLKKMNDKLARDTFSNLVVSLKKENTDMAVLAEDLTVLETIPSGL